MKEYIEKKMDVNRRCPVCKEYTLNYFGKCTNSRCPTYGKSRKYYGKLAIERVRLGKCPNCAAPLKVLRGYKTDEGRTGLEIECSTYKEDCRLVCNMVSGIR